MIYILSKYILQNYPLFRPDPSVTIFPQILRIDPVHILNPDIISFSMVDNISLF